jgi:hypothetical protein
MMIVASQINPTTSPRDLARVPRGNLTRPSQGTIKIKTRDSANAILRMVVLLQYECKTLSGWPLS